MRLKISLTVFIATLFIFAGTAQQKNDPVVLEINHVPVTKSEFLRIYLKNNQDPKYDKETLDEYVELYKNFKLKVADAKALKYDTIPSIKQELATYKKQLSHPYLVDTKKAEALIVEAYDRMKEEINASHILINVKPDAAPEDTLKAYNKVMKLRKRILNGEDFGEVAATSSDDKSAKKNKGDLGYFSAFQMVYPFETAAYQTEVGKVSMPTRTRFGYHLVKVHDKRPARGKIKVAHIMIANGQNPTRSELEKAEQKANEIYKELEEGKKFSALAKLYSDDQGSKQSGGELSEFGTGTTQRMIPEFEEAAFALENDGDFSEPIKINNNFHIIKRISLEPLGSFEELKPMIKQKVNQGDRAKQSEESFIRELKTKNQFKDKSNKRLKWFYENIDSTIFTNDWIAPEVNKNQWLFQYQKQKYDGVSFMEYIKTHKTKRAIPVQTHINRLYAAWQNELIIQDEKSRLEDEYPEYKALLEEYTDGVLLYEIMKNKVWDKAITDTAGLDAFFNENIDQYQWPDRVAATIFSAEKKEFLEEAKALSKIDSLSFDDIMSKVNSDSQLNIEGEKGKFIPSEKEELDQIGQEKGSQPIYEKDGRYYLVIVDEFLPAGAKKLTETRGLVVQDYQNYLENEWIQELRNKYTIKVNHDVLYNIGE